MTWNVDIRDDFRDCSTLEGECFVSSDPDGSLAVRPAGSPGELTYDRIESLPKEVGVLLVALGVLGLALPGPLGTPALLAGGLVLWPAGFRGMVRCFERRFPNLHRSSFRQLSRFLADLERRYPSSPT
jgi:hypothetical protein